MTDTTTAVRLDELDDHARAELYERLYRVTSALSAAALPEEVVTVMFAQALDVLRADGGFVGLIDAAGASLRVNHLADYSGVATEQVELSVAEELPLVATALDGQPRFISSNEDLSCNFPGLRRLDASDHACATVPLQVGGEPRGALNVAFNEPREFSAVERTIIDAIAVHCSAALERAERLRDAEAELADRRALAVHDEVVQELAVAKLLLENERPDDGLEAVRRALDAAKQIVASLVPEDPRYRLD